jgi:hypothetical protein
LVCKSWQNSVETLRLDRSTPKCILSELFGKVKNDSLPSFYSKYLKVFRRVLLNFRSDFDITKWYTIQKVLLTNLKNLTLIGIGANNLPSQFKIFLFDLFRNSQFTLHHIKMASNQMICLPTIPLQNLTIISIKIQSSNNFQVGSFDNLMKSVVEKCENLDVISIQHINNAPKILEYMVENYPQHFAGAPEISVLEKIPLKLSPLNLEKLAAYRYFSHIEYLLLHIPNISQPSQGGWDNYEQILAFCPNLKGIRFLCKTKNGEIGSTNLNSINLALFPANIQNIWNQRKAYFETKNVKILSLQEYKAILSQIKQSLPTSWYFRFKF